MIDKPEVSLVSYHKVQVMAPRRVGKFKTVIEILGALIR